MMSKGQSESVNRRKADNTIAKGKMIERTNNNLQRTTKKIKDRATLTSLKPKVNSGAPEGSAVPVTHVAHVMLLLLQTR